MRTTITIECDIIDAQVILYSASKIIRKREEWRNQEKNEPLLIKRRVLDVQKIEVGGTTITTCPFCNWSGAVGFLKVDNMFNTSCPECGTIITKLHHGVDIYRFMSYDNEEKQKHTCVRVGGVKQDIRIYDRGLTGMFCTLCGLGTNTERTSLVGQKDTREPKYCYVHYISHNESSRFVRKVGDHA